MKRMFILLFGFVALLSFSNKVTGFTYVELPLGIKITSGAMWNYKINDKVSFDVGVGAKVGLSVPEVIYSSPKPVTPFAIIAVPLFKWEMLVKSRNTRVDWYFGTTTGVGLAIDLATCLGKNIIYKDNNKSEIKINEVVGTSVDFMVHTGIRIDNKGIFGVNFGLTSIGIEFGGIY